MTNMQMCVLSTVTYYSENDTHNTDYSDNT